MSTPKYWGTPRGQVIRAIAEKRALQYDELLSETGLEPSQLDTAIEELMDDGVLDLKDWDQHWVDNDLWHEYRAYLGDERSKEIVEERARDYDLVVEFWGLVDADDERVRTRYVKTMRWKMAQYHSRKIKFVSIYPSNLSNLDWVFRKKFEQVTGQQFH